MQTTNYFCAKQKTRPQQITALNGDVNKIISTNYLLYNLVKKQKLKEKSLGKYM